MNKVELISRNLRAIFQLPAGFVPVSQESGKMSLRCCFPSMAPITDDVPMEEIVDLYLAIGRGTGRFELLLSGDGPVLEPSYLRQTSRIGPIGRYEIYQEDRIQAGLSHRVVTYIFHADDGAIVGIEDPGDKFDRYQCNRAVAELVHLQYSVSKEFGDDFIEIDSRVAGFVKSILLEVGEIAG